MPEPEPVIDTPMTQEDKWNVLDKYKKAYCQTLFDKSYKIVKGIDRPANIWELKCVADYIDECVFHRCKIVVSDKYRDECKTEEEGISSSEKIDRHRRARYMSGRPHVDKEVQDLYDDVLSGKVKLPVVIEPVVIEPVAVEPAVVKYKHGDEKDGKFYNGKTKRWITKQFFRKLSK